MRRIRGAGGGKDGGGSQARVPTEAKDSLKSTANAKVLDLLTEGPIAGLKNGLESIFLDETPLIDPSTGQYNFQNLQFDFRSGTQSQSYIPLFSDTESEIGVGVEVKQATPVVRTINDANIDAIFLRMSIPQMTEQNTSTGDLAGSQVQIQIDLQSNGGGYVTQFVDKIIGKSTSKYERQYRIELTGSPPWDIKFTRLTADSASVAVQNKTYWESYTQIIDSKLRYPNSALVGVKIDSTQFSSVPNRAYEIQGMIIQIPSNYDPNTRAYSGSWDGTFVNAYSNNPAWVFYDLLTNDRYGLGNYINASQIDKWALYTIGKYCDEYVSDGFGSTEPRYTLNTYIQTRQEAYQLLQTMASAFNAMIYWAEGSITLTQDAPSDAAYLFTPANVIDGLFTYSGASLKTKHSVALVTWNDPDDFYRQKVEYVEDPESVAQLGYVEAQVVAFGCTSRGQAHRYGKWLLYTERAQSDVVSFRTGLNAALIRPGQIIKIADPVRAGVRLGGRIQSATTSKITTDQTQSFSAAGASVSIVKADGTLETKAVASVSVTDINITGTFSEVPANNSLWIVELPNVEAQYFRVISIGENEGGEHEITAIAHDPDKFAIIEQNLQLAPAQISLLNVTPDAPVGLQITETLYESNGSVRVKVTVSWNVVQFAATYLVQYRKDGGNIVTLAEVSSNEVELLDADPGSYEVTVYAINTVGTESLPSTLTQTVLGKSAPPADVAGFSAIPQASMCYLSWDKATDLDVLLGGSVRIRWASNLTGADWSNAVDITPALAGSSTRAQVPLLVGTYMAKFIDSSGNASSNVSSIVVDGIAAYNLNVVSTVTESPGFAGTKTDMEYNATFGGLIIGSGVLFDDIPDVDALLSWDFGGGIAAEGEYEFATKVDLGDIYTSRLTAAIDVVGKDIADTIDVRSGLMDDWADFDGLNVDDVNAELYLASTEDDPNDPGAIWTDWKRFFVGEYSARGYKFKVKAYAYSDFHTPCITSLGVTVDMPDRDEKQRNITSGAATYTVAYLAAFKATPAIAITAYNMNSGDYWAISNQTVSGFDIVFKNSAGTSVSRNFDYLARGYGRVN
jgi:predicted phage tail protein